MTQTNLQPHSIASSIRHIRSPEPSRDSWQSWLDEHHKGALVLNIGWNELRGHWVIQTTAGYWTEP